MQEPEAKKSTLKQMSKQLVEQLDAFMTENGLVGQVAVDHICIRCSSNEIYEKRREDYEMSSHFIYQSIISERRISVIGLKESIATVIGDIKYLELSDQKKDNSQTDRIDHVEIVPTTISYKELVTKLETQCVAMKEIVRPHHTTYDIVLPSGFKIKLSTELLIDKIKREEMPTF